MGNKLKEKFRQESDERENSFLDQGDEIKIKKSKENIMTDHDSCGGVTKEFRLEKG